MEELKVITPSFIYGVSFIKYKSFQSVIKNYRHENGCTEFKLQQIIVILRTKETDL